MRLNRRTFVSASLALLAGCTAPVGTDTSDGNNTDTPPDSTEPPDGSTLAEVPDYTVWSRDLPHDELGMVSLGGGPETPAIFASSAAEDGASDDHALHALTLQEGVEQWRLGVADPVQTVPTYVGRGAGPRFVFATGRQPSVGEGFVLHAIDPDATERVWRFETEAERAIFPIATADEQVFVGRRDDQLGESGEYVYALDVGEGTEQWRTETGDVSRTGNARRRDTLLVDTPQRVRALAVEGGDERWSVEAASQAYDNRAERVFVQDENVVRGLDLADGSEVWRREFDFGVSRITSPRQAMDETVFVGDSDGRLLALSPLDGGTRWTLSVDSDGFEPSVERTSEWLLVSGAGVHAVDDVSGEAAWSFTPAIEDRVEVETGAPSTVFARTRRHVWALDPETGEERWQFAPGGRFAGVSTAGDFAFVGVGGAVYALDGSEST